MNFFIFVVSGILACELLIQKEIDHYLIQSECKIIKIMDYENAIEFTYLSENQIIIQEVNETQEYLFKFHNKRQKKQAIIPNTKELQKPQDQVNELGIQSRYQIVLDNLLYDIAAAFIKGLLLLLI